MAIINSLAIGKARKSAGNLTFATIQGRTIAREKPVNVRNPRTEKQLAQRSKMAKTVAAYRSIGFMTKHLFTKLPKYTSQYNQFVKENIKLAENFEVIEETGKVTNVEGLVVSNGDILPFDTTFDIEYGDATYAWDDNEAAYNFIKHGDYWVVIAVEENTGNCHVVNSPAYVADGASGGIEVSMGESYENMGLKGPVSACAVYYSPSRNISSVGRLQRFENPTSGS